MALQKRNVCFEMAFEKRAPQWCLSLIKGAIASKETGQEDLNGFVSVRGQQTSFCLFTTFIEKEKI